MGLKVLLPIVFRWSEPQVILRASVRYDKYKSHHNYLWVRLWVSADRPFNASHMSLARNYTCHIPRMSGTRLRPCSSFTRCSGIHRSKVVQDLTRRTMDLTSELLSLLVVKAVWWMLSFEWIAGGRYSLFSIATNSAKIFNWGKGGKVGLGPWTWPQSRINYTIMSAGQRTHAVADDVREAEVSTDKIEI